LSFYNRLVNKDTTIIFEEVATPPLLQHEIKATITVSIYQNRKYVARYSKDCNFELTEPLFYVFIQRFLSSKAYRNKLNHTGEWDGNYKVLSSLGIHDNCLRQIAYINTIDKPSQNDLLELRTHGRDSFSTKRKEELLLSLPVHQIRVIQQEFSREVDSEKSMLSALRWLARGLRADSAIKKVRADREYAREVAIGR
jgi:hypothetical protein